MQLSEDRLRRFTMSFCLCRLHGVKIAHRKAENQIKMAKMIMMNELNKRANLLIEQLEVITFFLYFLLIVQPAKNVHAKCNQPKKHANKGPQ